MHYIHGEMIQDKGTSFTSHNPATGKIIWHGTMAQQSTIDLAFESAKKAFPLWSTISFQQRVSIIQRFIQKVHEKLPILKILLSQETGKPLWEAEGELKALAYKLTCSIEAYHERAQTLHIEETTQTLHLQFKPLGITCVLGAFNLPVHLSHGHIIPALLAGNVVIYKPSELTPAISQAIMSCWHDSELPPGVINLVQGSASTAQKLLTYPFKAIYFTGSYQTGCKIYKKLSPVVLLTLEMGGNNPLIIDTTQYLKAAVYQTLLSCFITTGQRCSCVRRLMIPDNDFGDLFLSRFIQATQQLTIGPYTDIPEPFMGPLITKKAFQHALQTQSRLCQQGAHLVLPMRTIQRTFVSPGILEAPRHGHIEDSEIFAPLVTVWRYKTFEEAVQLANQTEYGLSAGLFSDNHEHFQYFYHHVQAGFMSWNRPTTGASSRLPFGGIGKSGNYRPSAYFATDYCMYPHAYITQPHLTLPDTLLPGITV